MVSSKAAQGACDVWQGTTCLDGVPADDLRFYLARLSQEDPATEEDQRRQFKDLHEARRDYCRAIVEQPVAFAAVLMMLEEAAAGRRSLRLLVECNDTPDDDEEPLQRLVSKLPTYFELLARLREAYRNELAVGSVEGMFKLKQRIRSSLADAIEELNLADLRSRSIGSLVESLREHERKLQTVDSRAAAEVEALVSRSGYDDHLLRVAEFRKRFETIRKDLCRSNLGLVVHVSRRYRFSRVPLMDLIQEGNLGLLRALDEFDPCLGYRFSTYAALWIRQTIQKAVLEQPRMIRVPANVYGDLQKIRKNERVLYGLKGRLPTEEETHQLAALNPQRVGRARDAHRRTLPLHGTGDFGTKSETRLVDIVADRSSDVHSDFAECRRLRSTIDDGIKALSPRSRRIVELRFGLVEGAPRSLKEIGSELEISRERVRQILASSLEELKRSVLAEL